MTGGCRLAVVGAGYVGLTAAACLASLGHWVVCADVDAAKVARLRAGEVGLWEPGLAELVADGLASGRLRFVVGASAAIGQGVEAVFLCLPTPRGAGGAADLSAVASVVAELRDLLPAGCVVVSKSTVPVGTAARIERLLGRDDITVVSNPEFLREGSAVRDFMRPDRIVVGCDRPAGAERVAALYSPLDAPVLCIDAASAELVKYAANCLLAVKISYINALAELCERLGADIGAVREAMSGDQRIGPWVPRPGPGWGGSCLPKDLAALRWECAELGVEFSLLDAATVSNERGFDRVVDKVRAAVGGSLAGRRVGVLGLTFKAGTDDLRESPALAVADRLAGEGAELTGYDPTCPAGILGLTDMLRVVDDPLMTAKDADALVVLTEWPQFRDLDWPAMARMAARRIVVDARDVLDPETTRRAGFVRIGIGSGR